MSRRIRPRVPRWIAWALPAALIVLSCRFVPGFAALWTCGVIRPLSALLSRVSAKAPFPLLEAFALACTAWALWGAVTLPVRCLRAWGLAPLARFAKRVLAWALAVALAYALLWYPAYFAVGPQAHAATAEQVAALCEALIDRLNAVSYTHLNKSTDNSRNGHSGKTLRTSFGDVEVSVPRDRKGEFEPRY